MASLLTIGGKHHETKDIFITIDGKYRQIKNAFITVNDVYKQVYESFNAEKVFIDFDYTDNGDGTYTLIRWKETLNGAPSTECVIPDCITSINEGVFSRCESLTSIIIPNSVTSIDNRVFGGCTNLASIAIPDSVTSIGKDAFNDTAYYNNIDNWENKVLYIGNHLIRTNGTITGQCVIKNNTICIADYAFSYCSDLSFTSITIPNSVTNIGNRAFYNCQGLKSITIPSSVTRIGFDAFSGCVSLRTLNVGFAKGAVSGAPWGATNTSITYNYNNK